MTGERPEPPRQVWHFPLLIALAFVILVSHLVSDRPMMIASFNNVAPVGDLPPAVTDVIDDWSITIHRSDWNGPVALALGRTGDGRRVRLGWVVREWSLMTLPLFAYRQSDLAAFREDMYGYRLLGLTPGQLRVVATATGTPWFPWWRFAWGWLAVTALGLFVWAELRWQARRRALLELI